MILNFIFYQNTLAQIDSTRFSIGKIYVHGNHLYSKNKIIELSELPINAKFSLTTLKQSINQLLKHYQTKGYYFTEVDSIVIIFDDNNNLNASLNYFINERTKLHFNKIVLNSDNLEHKKILESMIDYRDHQSIDQQLEANINDFITYMENIGYPFCRINIDSLVLKQYSKLNAYLSIYSGPMVTIDKITIQGNKITKDKVIIRETRLQLSEIYNQKKVSKIPNRLLKLGFLKQVDDPELLLDDQGKSELVIKVVEGNMNKVDGVIGYNPEIGNKKGFFTGLIDISLANLLGTGRRFQAYWEKKDVKTQQLKFRYQEPWLLGLPIHIGGWFQQQIQDTSYIRRNWMFDVSLPFSENIMVFTNIGKEQISPDSIGSALWNIPKSRSWLLNLGVTYDNRNNPVNPSKGVFYQTTMEFSRKKIDQFPGDSTQSSSFNRKKITMDVELLIPTFKWQVISLALHGRQVSSNEPQISISDVFRFGGSNSLRGYREDEFLGTKIAWINAEYRYLLSSRSRIFLFIDNGYYLNESSAEKEIKDYKFGYGFGIRLDTRLGIIGVDYGLGEGRGLSNGLIHVRLISEF